ncbi:MAG: sorbosone dehydrogenase family protein [Sandaracinaceae bacterium]
MSGRAILGALALVLAACDGGTPADAGLDAGPFDAGRRDAGVDAGSFDAGRCEDTPLPALSTVELVPGHTFDQPVGLYQAPGDDETFYVVEQPGRILLVRDGAVLGTPFLDITDRVTLIGERGLLGLAFDPDYAVNGRFFVYYTDGNPPVEPPGTNVLAEYHRSTTSPDEASHDEIARLIEAMPLRGNHCGGNIAFGPDGYLYGSIGDGASLYEPMPDAQNRDNPLGSIVRFDVDAPATGYVAPGGPFTDGDLHVYAYGLRNPWRWSFDRMTGDMIIGDVGENRSEEIDLIPAGSGGGQNFGWPAYEGVGELYSSIVPMVPMHTEPLYEMRRGGLDPYLSTPCSIIGGFTYRGSAIEGLYGVYFYGDYCDIDVAAFRLCDGAIVGHQRVMDLRQPEAGLSAFAQDNAGELYMLNVTAGRILRIVPG